MTAELGDISLEVDCKVETSEINLKLAEELACIEPCGVGNPQPMLMTERATVQTADAIGDGKHTKLTLSGKTALLFGVPLAEADVLPGETVDAVFRLDINEFRGTKTEQMMLCDLRIAGLEGTEEADVALLERIENGENFSDPDILPTRDDFAVIYKEVRSYGEEGRDISLYRLGRILERNGAGMRAAKLKLSLMILADVGLIYVEKQRRYTVSGSELYRIGCAKTTEKVNLFGTPRYKNVKSRFVK